MRLGTIYSPKLIIRKEDSAAKTIVNIVPARKKMRVNNIKKRLASIYITFVLLCES